MKFDIAPTGRPEQGIRRITWAENDMPVLRLIGERLGREKPLAGLRVSGCLHITSETANLARTLKAGGASVALCGSNPLSTQDDVAAALVKKYGISVFAIRGEDRRTYYDHIQAAIAHKPDLVIDDGADFISTIHSKRPEAVKKIRGAMEETTTGVLRLRAMARLGKLGFPVFPINDASTKHLFDNRYGTGQSTVDGIMRATDILFAGKTIVVCGYGWCGRGFASKARGMGAKVIVTEVDPLRALEANMDGFWVMPMAKAARLGDVFCTLTGDIAIIRKEHFRLMKDGVILCNAGHFDVEVDLRALKRMAKRVRRVRDLVDEYLLPRGRKLYVISEGRLVNLTAATGHPASVMDMSFALQALTAEYAAKNGPKLKPGVYEVPRDIDQEVARLKLQTMGIQIDRLTPAQERYLASWRAGT